MKNMMLLNAAVACGGLLAAGVAWAQPVSIPMPEAAADVGQQLVGQWAGSQTAGVGLRAVTLGIPCMRIGARLYRLSFGMPRGCSMDAELAGFQGGEAVLALAATGGGATCDRLLDGFARVRPVDRDAIDLVLMNTKGVGEAPLRLKRQPMPPGAEARCEARQP